MPPCVWTQYAMVSAYRTECGRAFSFWTHVVKAFSIWMQPYHGIFLLDTAMSGYFPSGRSRVRAMASGRHVSWYRGYAGCQGREPRSKYSRRIHKHAVSSRYSDSVQLYYLSISNVYLCMLLPHFVFSAQAPSVTSVAAIITCSNAVLMCVALLWVSETMESWQIRHDTMCPT